MGVLGTAVLGYCRSQCLSLARQPPHRKAAATRTQIPTTQTPTANADAEGSGSKDLDPGGLRPESRSPGFCFGAIAGPKDKALRVIGLERSQNKRSDGRPEEGQGHNSETFRAKRARPRQPEAADKIIIAAGWNCTLFMS